MMQKQIKQLRSVLKIEQQTLNAHIQNFQLEAAKLNNIRTEIDSQTKLRESILTSDTPNPSQPNIDITRNRIQFIQTLESAIALLADSEARQRASLYNAKSKVNQQRTRVNAIEKMMEKIQIERREKENYFEDIELSDAVLNKFMEQQK